jgi:uncharacterized DUF497 family protein
MANGKREAARLEIYELVVDPDREEHIARHRVTIQEVESVVYGRPFVRRIGSDRFRVIGRTDAGRFVTVFVGDRGDGRYGLITAREATQAERRQYQLRRR